MAKGKNPAPRAVPPGHQAIDGSGRVRGTRSRLLGPADAGETITVTVVLRRRADGPGAPDLEYWARMPVDQRTYPTAEEFARQYGASQADVDAVVKHLRSAGLQIVETHLGRRSIRATGTVAQVGDAFTVDLNQYESPLPPQPRQSATRHHPRRQSHRGYEGQLHVPRALAPMILGVFGLDNRRITSRSTVPPNTSYSFMTVPLLCQLYGWPVGAIAGQTIGLLSDGGFDPNDIKLYYQNLNKSIYQGGYYVQDASGYTPWNVPAGAVAGNLVAPSSGSGTLVVASGTNSGSSDGEVNMDISLSSTIAQQATIAVYIMDGTSNGWITALQKATIPGTGEPAPGVISSSYYLAGGDDPKGLAEWGASASELASITSYFQDAATMGITVCIASGDNGTDSNVEDGYAHVQYPVSDPWVLGCGGTTVGNISGSKFDEYIWNDTGATGGGVSAYFNSNNVNPAMRQPSYQSSTAIPASLNDSSIGRGVPDVSANASAFSGYSIYTGGYWGVEGGTSAAAPVIAGFIAQVNAKIGKPVGFLNPQLYGSRGSCCRKIAAGVPLSGSLQNPPPRPSDNACHGVAGYTGTQTGWDACTGWGVFNWQALIALLTKVKEKELIKEHIKEIKDKDKELIKENFKAEVDVKSISDFLPPGNPGDPYEWLQILLTTQGLEQLKRISQSLEQLDKTVGQRVFIRPEERPEVGGQAIAASVASAAGPAATKAARPRRKRGR